MKAPGLPRFGAPICFENSFPGLDRELVRQGAEFLVVLTNNASYDETSASAQHLQMSRIRAIEDGRWVVHAAVPGSARSSIPAVARSRRQSSSTRPHQADDPCIDGTYAVRALGRLAPVASLAFAIGLAAVPRGRRAARDAPEPLGPGLRTLVILPTLDEARTIREVVAGVLALPGIDVLVVDDSSPDGTSDIVRELMAGKPRLRLVERPARDGLASAYLQGFARALDEGYDLVVEMDSDLSHDPTQLASLLDAARHRYHLVVGSRYIPGGSVTNWGRARSHCRKRATSTSVGCSASPCTTRPAATASTAASSSRTSSRTPSTPTVGLPGRAVMRSWLHGWTIGEVPITFREREHGQSRSRAGSSSRRCGSSPSGASRSGSSAGLTGAPGCSGRLGTCPEVFPDNRHYVTLSWNQEPAGWSPTSFVLRGLSPPSSGPCGSPARIPGVLASRRC